jgi:hypothetical protein
LRATPEVHKAEVQRGSRAGFGSNGSSPPLLPVVAPAATKAGRERWSGYRDSKGLVCYCFSFGVLCVKCEDSCASSFFCTRTCSVQLLVLMK